MKKKFWVVLLSIICISCFLLQKGVSASEDVSADSTDAEYLEEDVFEDEQVTIADPIYVWNKGMYYFNDKFYFWIMKPVSVTYGKVVHEDLRVLVNNFFYNLATPVRLVNDLLQLKMKKAGNELVRFAVNTTVGVGGLGDIAQAEFDIQRHDEDFGQTLGSYGIGNGFYIVWPLLGPSSVRDTVGLVGDWFLDPLLYHDEVGIHRDTAIGLTVFDKVNATSFRIGDYEALKDAAIDPYEMLKDAYIQYRKKKVDE
jgi:phospholipid-binding lipoprotein MlaA